MNNIIGIGRKENIKEDKIEQYSEVKLKSEKSFSFLCRSNREKLKEIM